MPHMPKHLGVGPIFKTLEDRYADPATARETLRRLRETRSDGTWTYALADIGSIAAVGPVTNHQVTPTTTLVTSQMKAHLNKHWFGAADPPTQPTTGWWNSWRGEPEATMREALTRALEISMHLPHGAPVPEEPKSTQPLAIVKASLGWVKGLFVPSAHRRIQFFWVCGLPRFETYVSWNSKTVTVVVLTPGWDYGLDHDFTADPPTALEPWVQSKAEGIIFVGQNVASSSGAVVQMQPGVVVHRMDIKRDGRGTWP